MVKRIIRTRNIKDKLKILNTLIQKQRIKLEDQLAQEIGMVEYLESNYKQIKDVNNYLRQVRSSRINSKKGSLLNSIRSSNYIQNFNLNQNAMGPNIAYIHTGRYAIERTPPTNNRENLVVIRDEDEHFSKLRALTGKIHSRGGRTEAKDRKITSMTSSKSPGDRGSDGKLRSQLIQHALRSRNNASSNLLGKGKRSANNFSLNADEKVKNRIGNRSLDRLKYSKANFFKKLQENFVKNSPEKGKVFGKKSSSSRKAPVTSIHGFSNEKFVSPSKKRMRLKPKDKAFVRSHQASGDFKQGSNVESVTKKKLEQKVRDKVTKSQKLKNPKQQKKRTRTKSKKKNSRRGKMLIESLGKAFNKGNFDKPRNTKNQKRKLSPRKAKKTAPKHPKVQARQPPKPKEENFIKVRISNNNSKIDSEIAEVAPHPRLMMSTTPKYTKQVLPDDIMDDRAQSLASITMDSEKEAEMQRQMAIRDSPRLKRKMLEEAGNKEELRIRVNKASIDFRKNRIDANSPNDISIGIGNKDHDVDLFEVRSGMLFESQQFN